MYKEHQKTTQKTTTTSIDGGDHEPLRESIFQKLTTYGITPSSVPELLASLTDHDLQLLPLLFQRLDHALEKGKIKNQAGLLRTWLSDFSPWRKELTVELEQMRTKVTNVELTSEADFMSLLMEQWNTECTHSANELYNQLSEQEQTGLKAKARLKLLQVSPNARFWSEEQWKEPIESFVRAELRARQISFEEWLVQRQVDTPTPS